MSFEQHTENASNQALTVRNNALDMQAVAKLSDAPAQSPTHNALQDLTGDKFPNFSLSNDAHADKYTAKSNDGHSEKGAANSEHNNSPLHKLMQHAITASQKIHSALGINVAAGGQPKEGSNCPAAGLRSALNGGGNKQA